MRFLYILINIYLYYKIKMKVINQHKLATLLVMMKIKNKITNWFKKL